MDFLQIGIGLAVMVFAPYLATPSIASKINVIGAVLKGAKFIIDKSVKLSNVVENSKGGASLEQEIKVVQEKSKDELLDHISEKASKKIKIFKKEDVKKFLEHTAEVVEDSNVEEKFKKLISEL